MIDMPRMQRLREIISEFDNATTNEFLDDVNSFLSGWDIIFLPGSAGCVSYLASKCLSHDSTGTSTQV